MRNFIFIAAAAALAGCAEGEQVTETPENIEVDISSQTSPAGADNGSGNAGSAADGAGTPAQAAPGQWFTKTMAQGPWAGYGPANSEAAFSVRCEGERLVFSTTEMPPSGSGPTDMHLTTEGVDEILAAQASEEGLPNTEASVLVSADWLRRLVDAPGNLSVTVGGSDPLIVPIGTPLTSLVRDCGR